MAAKPPTAKQAAKKLLTESGYLEAVAEIYLKLSGGGLPRDEVSALIGARRCLESFASTRLARVAASDHAELTKELRATRAAMAVTGNGATGFTKDQIQLPRRPSAGNSKN